MSGEEEVEEAKEVQDVKEVAQPSASISRGLA